MFTSEPVLEVSSTPDFWVVVAPLKWEAPDLTATIPTGFMTDLASIPEILRNIFDVDGRSRNAAILHDWLYATQRYPRAFCDEQLRKGLIAYGEKPWQAQLYYLGVRLGGNVAWQDHFCRSPKFDTREHLLAWTLSGRPV